MKALKNKNEIIRLMKEGMEEGEYEALFNGLIKNEKKIQKDLDWLKPLFWIVVGRAFK
jgi:hypothetical protein